MLRAVLTLNQLESLLSPELVAHVGHDFPQASDVPITLVEISDEEGTATWPVGFCRVQATPTDFDERLRFLPEASTPPDRPSSQVRRNGSELIHWLTRDMRAGVVLKKSDLIKTVQVVQSAEVIHNLNVRFNE
jgi:hypothetical protein